MDKTGNIKYNKATALYNEMMYLKGAHEWDNAVGMIQEWFYGSYVRASWCATTVSYAANRAGLKIGKSENVYLLMTKCKLATTGKFFTRDHLPETIKRGDILFWLWSGTTMRTDSSKHVGVCTEDTPLKSAMIPCIGGNQSKSVCIKNYSTDRLYAVYRPE